jgi:biotin operon repressor
MKGIWIPIELIEMDISWTKRILLAEISQLEMLDKGCIASNAHFSEKLKLSKQAISKALNELNKDGYIEIDNAQTKRNFGRKITINFGKSGINFGKSGIHQSGETKENTPVNNPINRESKGKRFTPPSFEEVENYAIERGRHDLAREFYDYFEAGDWHDKNGDQVKSWKQKFITWTNYQKPQSTNQQRANYASNEINW